MKTKIKKTNIVLLNDKIRKINRNNDNYCVYIPLSLEEKEKFNLGLESGYHWKIELNIQYA